MKLNLSLILATKLLLLAWTMGTTQAALRGNEHHRELFDIGLCLDDGYSDAVCICVANDSGDLQFCSAFVDCLGTPGGNEEACGCVASGGGDLQFCSAFLGCLGTPGGNNDACGCVASGGGDLQFCSAFLGCLGTPGGNNDACGCVASGGGDLQFCSAFLGCLGTPGGNNDACGCVASGGGSLQFCSAFLGCLSTPGGNNDACGCVASGGGDLQFCSAFLGCLGTPGGNNEACGCVASGGGSLDFCKCVTKEGADPFACCVASGQDRAGCACAIRDGGSPEYCQACLQSLGQSGFDVAKIDQYGDWMSASTVFTLPQTGVYYGADGIGEYYRFLYSTFFPQFIELSEPEFKFYPPSDGKFEGTCEVAVIGNRKFGLNKKYFEKACLRTTQAGKLTYTPTEGNTNVAISRIDGWIPSAFLKTLYGSLKVDPSVSWLCDTMKSTCNDVYANANSFVSDVLETDKEKCVAQYKTLPVDEGTEAYVDGASIGCKILHANIALVNDFHCPHASFVALKDGNNAEKCQSSAGASTLYSSSELDEIAAIAKERFNFDDNLFDENCAGGGADGDPHFLDWGNEWFDYHGQCDLMLLNAPSFATGLGLTATIRTKARFEYSYIEGAAIRIGDDILEVGSFGQYFLNGVDGAQHHSHLGHLAGFPINHRVQNEKEHIFTVDMGDHGRVTLKTYKDLVGIKFDAVSSVDFGDSEGLMGSYGKGTHFSRDGKTILEDPNAFGQEWQCGDEDPQLFITKAPSGKCIMMLPAPKGDTSRALGETIGHEEAERACAHHRESFDQCVYDVIATGDIGVANAGVF